MRIGYIRVALNRCFGVAAIILLASACSGCGKKSNLAPVRGTVLLDNKPLASGGILTMTSEGGQSAHGVIRNGEFELSTFGNGDGAFVGTHKVAIMAREPSTETGPEAADGKLFVPQRYIRPELSGLEIEVKAGEVNTPTLKLTSP